MRTEYNTENQLWFQPRVGFSDNCPSRDIFYDPSDIIITSQMAVSDLVNNNNDNVLPLAVPLVKKHR